MLVVPPNEVGSVVEEPDELVGGRVIGSVVEEPVDTGGLGGVEVDPIPLGGLGVVVPVGVVDGVGVVVVAVVVGVVVTATGTGTVGDGPTVGGVGGVGVGTTGGIGAGSNHRVPTSTTYEPLLSCPADGIPIFHFKRKLADAESPSVGPDPS